MTRTACLLLAAALIAGAPHAFAQSPDAARTTPPTPSFQLAVRAPDDVRTLLERNLELRRYREVQDLDDAEIARLLRLAERDVRQLVGTLGYFDPQIRITRENGTPPTIVVAVEPGQPALVQDVDVAFDGDIAATADAGAQQQREQVRSGWGLPPGQRFTQERWDAAKRDALRGLTRHRYPAARLADSLADIDAAASRAHLGLRLDSGPPFRLGEFRVSGMARYDPALVPRIARLPPGSVYDQDSITQAQLRLAGSGYFDSAFIFVDPESPPDAAPVQVTVREAPLKKLVLGPGFTTDSGPRLTAEFTHNRVPGIGWRAVTKASVERKQPFLESEWTAIPDERGWRWSTLARVERLDDGEIVTHGQRARFGRFRSDEHIDRNVYLQYEHASVDVSPGVPLTPAQAGQGQAISVNYQWTGRWFRTLPSPDAGFGAAFELGGGITLDDHSPFQRTVVRWLGLHPLSQGRLQLRAEAGAVLAKQSANIPSTLLFRTGGDTSVRGYGYRDIGVALPGNRVGPGRYEAVGSVEWQRPLRRAGLPSDLESIAFVDAGAVANRIGSLRPAVGVGAGVRWKSPVGPVEAAIAYGQRTKKFRLHLTVGFTF